MVIIGDILMMHTTKRCHCDVIVGIDDTHYYLVMGNGENGVSFKV